MTLITGRGVTPESEPCVNCPHTLADHQANTPGGYMKCQRSSGEQRKHCSCPGYCDRASVWWFDDSD